MIRLYVNNFADPLKLWSVDHGPDTEEKHYYRVYFNGACGFTGVNLDADPSTSSRAWVELGVVGDLTEEEHVLKNGGVILCVLPRNR